MYDFQKKAVHSSPNFSQSYADSMAQREREKAYLWSGAWKDKINDKPEPPKAPKPPKASAPSAQSQNLAYLQELERQRQLRESQRRFVESSFNALISQLQESHNYSLGQANSAADKSLQNAYVNKMKTERDLPQKLSALGITGGASESTLAGVQNSYGQSRNEVEAQRAQSIAKLLQQLQKSKADAEATRTKQLIQLGIY